MWKQSKNIKMKEKKTGGICQVIEKRRDPFFAVLFVVIFLWFLFELLHCHLCALSFLLCHLCVPHINTRRKLYDGRTSSASEAECIDKGKERLNEILSVSQRQFASIYSNENVLIRTFYFIVIFFSSLYFRSQATAKYVTWKD